MKASDFKVGDIVRIRQWDDMELEFGTDRWGHIRCNQYFTEQMKPVCGLKARILWIGKGGESASCNLEFFGLPKGFHNVFMYSTDMIEPEEKVPVETGKDDMSKLLADLGGLF